ncbi:MAG: hypothetical protein GOMPHAMPRED_004459 [Gomphillus americanus]|uniref:Prolyl 4-hydroxylase alpha subunit domain-containing protein n=1 Tax=Gomphillus americanus TaxID=1940652 RepID=A0A8H3FKH2_9LECA|nr:MAG: hypothetical protein GOMPHAMPRED_004459 [Gomphillus americanus]
MASTNNSGGAPSTTFSYDSEFLQTSAPFPTKSSVDFVAGGIPQYDGHYAVILDGIFTAEECTQLVAIASAANKGVWDRALVNVGGGRQAHLTDIRNCGRILYDDIELTNRIWNRIKPHVPELLRIESPPKQYKTGLWSKPSVKIAKGLNERLRFLKYGPGEYFERHCDGRFAREALDGSGDEFSVFTIHLYLNEGGKEEEELIGGSTSFFSPWGYQGQEKEIRVKPKVGRVLIFQHAGLLHSGEEVLKGLKLTMRTDIMYQILKEEK